LWEEVDIIAKGGNYGWNIREGRHCFDPSQPNEPPDQCPDTGANDESLRNPIIEYSHDVGIAVIGGYVYRGSLLPQFEGRYIFGDWSTSFINPSGKIFVATPPESDQELWTMEEVEIATSKEGTLGAFVLSFGQDADRELYVLTSGLPGPMGNTGKVFKLILAP
jgi:hypothetical protein